MNDSQQLFDEMDVRRALLTAIDAIGGPESFAHRHGLTINHVLRVKLGGETPSDRLCKALGFEKRTRYVRGN